MFKNFSIGARFFSVTGVDGFLSCNYGVLLSRGNT